MHFQMMRIKSDPAGKDRDRWRNTATDPAMAPASGVENRGL